MRGPDEARVIERIAGVEGPGRRVDGPNAVMPPRHDELLDADVRPESRIEEHLEVIAAESGGQAELASDVVGEIGEAFVCVAPFSEERAGVHVAAGPQARRERHRRPAPICLDEDLSAWRDDEL